MPTIKIPLNADLTEVERHLPDGVKIGTPGLVLADPDDPESEVIGWISSHPKLVEEDEVLIDAAVKRQAATRRRDDEVVDPDDANERSNKRDALKTAMAARRKTDIDKIVADRAALNALER